MPHSKRVQLGYLREVLAEERGAGIAGGESVDSGDGMVVPPRGEADGAAGEATAPRAPAANQIVCGDLNAMRQEGESAIFGP